MERPKGKKARRSPQISPTLVEKEVSPSIPVGTNIHQSEQEKMEILKEKEHST